MLVETHKLVLGQPIPDQQQVYCGIDSCVTFEVWEAVMSLGEPPPVYRFERALQAPALEMMLRGFKIDLIERDKAVRVLEARYAKLESLLESLAEATLGKKLGRNKSGHLTLPRSFIQLQELFYSKLRLPEQWISVKGERKLSFNREVLEKLDLYLYARPLIALILAIRETAGKIEVLTTEIDPDGRFRTSINVGATETGRFSSSKSTTGTGGNLFNIEEELRRPFVADRGYKLFAVDLEQAESREIGFLCGVLFGDWSYLDACESGDVHTSVARMVWPNLPWTGDMARDNKLASETLYYRHHSHRQTTKKLGHASNYLMTPWTASRQIKIPAKVCEEFQARYFEAFPGIIQYHHWVAQQIAKTHSLTTIFGRTRHFFGRADDDTTIREAVAYCPQSATADRLNVGLLRIWEQLGKRVQVLLQLYDAAYFQFKETDDEQELARLSLGLIDVPVWHEGRKFTVPGEVKTGWNWAPYHPETNPDGLKKLKGVDTRKRSSIIDRIM